MNKDKRVTAAINTLVEMSPEEALEILASLECLDVDDAIAALNLYQEIDVSDPVKEDMWEEEIAPICDALLGEEEDA